MGVPTIVSDFSKEDHVGKESNDRDSASITRCSGLNDSAGQSLPHDCISYTDIDAEISAAAARSRRGTMRALEAMFPF